MKPKKSLGQNFLNDKKILNQITEVGKIKKKDIILEIGPGTGNLTNEILKKTPKKLLVVEKDNDLSNFLKKKYDIKIEVINKDILKCYDIFKFDQPIKVFGNLPYYLSTKLLTSFIKLNNLREKFEKFIFIFQKEVADRIVADVNTKNYGRLSIITSWKMSCEKITDIDPKYFYPKPKVWSSLIILTPKSKIERLINPKNLEHVTNIFFSQRRKMIKKPMKQLFADYKIIAKKLNLDLSLRPQNISKDLYLEICKCYEDLNH